MSTIDTAGNGNTPEDDWEGTAEVSESTSFETDPKSLSDLKSLRKLIDQKNKSIVRLLNRRAGYALRIAEVKLAEGLAIRDDEREKEVLKKVSRYNKGPLSDEALHRIFNCIMEEHRKLEGESKDSEGTVTDVGIDHER
jgi:chorismate mutase